MINKVVSLDILIETGWTFGNWLPKYIVSFCDFCNSQHSHTLIDSNLYLYECVNCKRETEWIKK